MDYAKQKQLTMANEIMNGNTEVNPYKRMDASGRKACDYCPYHGVCHFDVKLPGNQYRSLNKMSDDDVFREITKERGEEKDGESVDR